MIKSLTLTLRLPNRLAVNFVQLDFIWRLTTHVKGWFPTAKLLILKLEDAQVVSLGTSSMRSSVFRKLSVARFTTDLQVIQHVHNALQTIISQAICATPYLPDAWNSTLQDFAQNAKQATTLSSKLHNPFAFLLFQTALPTVVKADAQYAPKITFFKTTYATFSFKAVKIWVMAHVSNVYQVFICETDIVFQIPTVSLQKMEFVPDALMVSDS